MRQVSSIRALALWLLPVLVPSVASAAALLEGKPLVEALAGGGYVVIMRPATSPESPPTAAQAEPANVSHERQLDERGRKAAAAMGEALRRLRIPVGQVLSSTAYRALETARLAQFPEPHTYDDLAEAGTGPEQAGSLHAQVAVPPAAGTNTFIVTHLRNISAAVGADAKDLAAGEALVYRPNGKGSATLIARVKIEDWPTLVSARP